MNIRKFFFMVLFNSRYKNLKNQIELLRNNIKNPKNINEDRLERFLNFSIANSVYYKSLNKEYINEYPILTKEILKKNFRNIITIEEKQIEKYDKVTTSGSTGTPFQFPITSHQNLVKQAQLLYFGSVSNFDIGVRHAYIRAVKPSIIKQVVKNQYIISPRKMDKEWIYKSINTLKKKKIKMLLGHPTAINNIARVMKSEGIKIPEIEGIITTGENLTEEVRTNLKEAFGVMPFSRYSTMELGVLACEYGDGGSFLVNQVDFLIEVLDAKGNPVKEGESGSVVITDFNSEIIPLIRYDTGDFAKVKKCKDGLVYELERLEGRIIETIFTTKGEPISAFSINGVMRTYGDILHFQFIQHTELEYELKIMPLDTEKHEDYSSAISNLQELLGSDAVIILSIVKEIHTLKSGKSPYIINNYRTEKSGDTSISYV